jgi:hypothetical protein
LNFEKPAGQKGESTMRHSRIALSITIMVGVLLLISARDAFAYVDPGTGSYVLQMIMAGLLAAAFALKSYWRNITAFLSRLLSKK